MHDFHVLHAHVTRLDPILDTWNLVLSPLLSYMALQTHQYPPLEVDSCPQGPYFKIDSLVPL